MKNRCFLYTFLSCLLCLSATVKAGTGMAELKMRINVIQSTCETVTADNVDFGLVMADQIGTSQISDIKSHLKIDCYGGGPIALKVKFSPLNGSLDLNGGVIASSNPSVGYVLYWASPEVGSTGSPLKLEQELSFISPTSTGINTTSFYVRPIRLMGTVSGSHANTQVVIHVIYD